MNYCPFFIRVDLLRNLKDSLSLLSELIGLDLCKSLAEDDAMAVILWSATAAECMK